MLNFSFLPFTRLVIFPASVSLFLSAFVNAASPSVSFANIADGDSFQVGDNVNLRLNVDASSDIKRCKLFWNGQRVRTEKKAPYEWGIDVSGRDTQLADLAEGDYTALAKCTDATGQTGKASITISVGPEPVDSGSTEPAQTGLTVRISVPSTDVSLQSGESLGVVVEADSIASEIQHCDLSWNGSFLRREKEAPYTWGAMTTRQDEELRQLASGDYTVSATCVDGSGEASSDNVSIHVASVTAPEPPVEPEPVVDPDPIDPEPGQQQLEVNISWKIPSERVDGSPLQLNEIESYSLVYDSVVDLDNGVVVDFPAIDGSGRLVDSYAVTFPQTGTYYFRIAVSDVDGMRSELSETKMVYVY